MRETYYAIFVPAELRSDFTEYRVASQTILVGHFCHPRERKIYQVGGRYM
jgi:hypothetical protein